MATTRRGNTEGEGNQAVNDKLMLIREAISLPPIFSITGEALEQRNALIVSADKVQCVTSPEQSELCVGCARDIQTYLVEVEKTRKELTAPLLNAQRALKAAADEHLAPLAEQRDRLNNLAGAWAEAERVRVQAEERARAAEIARLEQIRVEAERKALEAQKALSNAPGQADDEEAYREAQEALKQAQIASSASQQAITAPLPAPQKASGARTQKKLMYEVTDINALYKARPELCKVEERPSAIQAVCFPPESSSVANPDTSVPGLKLWWENRTSTRRW